MSAIWELFTNTLWQQSVMQSCGRTVFGIYVKISLHYFGLAWDELHRMEVSRVFVLWVLSALHPTFHWWPVQAAAAMGSKYAWALPVGSWHACCSQKSRGGPEGSRSSWKRTAGWWICDTYLKTPCCSPGWRVISGKGVGWVKMALLRRAQRQEWAVAATLPSATSLLKFSPWGPS